MWLTATTERHSRTASGLQEVTETRRHNSTAYIQGLSREGGAKWCDPSSKMLKRSIFFFFFFYWQASKKIRVAMANFYTVSILGCNWEDRLETCLFCTHISVLHNPTLVLIEAQSNQKTWVYSEMRNDISLSSRAPAMTFKAVNNEIRTHLISPLLQCELIHAGDSIRKHNLIFWYAKLMKFCFNFSFVFPHSFPLLLSGWLNIHSAAESFLLVF